MLTKGWLHGPLEFIVTNFSGGGTRYRSFRTMLPLLRTPAVLLLFLSVMSPAAAAQWRINLQPVVTSGLTQPVLVTSARDGSGRLFIVDSWAGSGCSSLMGRVRGCFWIFPQKFFPAANGACLASRSTLSIRATGGFSSIILGNPMGLLLSPSIGLPQLIPTPRILAKGSS